MDEDILHMFLLGVKQQLLIHYDRQLSSEKFEDTKG
jgi:hypothetical protein